MTASIRGVARLVAASSLLLGGCGSSGNSSTSPSVSTASESTVSMPTVSTSTEFTLASSVFAEGGTLPVEYTCDGPAGANSPNPPLSWTGVPQGSVELALTMTTVALDGIKYNWVLFHIPAGVTSLAAGSTVGTSGVSTDGPELRYYPPCSQGPGAKTYTFRLYALSAVPTFSVPESQVTGPVLERAIASSTLATRPLDVSYTRR